MRMRIEKFDILIWNKSLVDWVIMEASHKGLNDLLANLLQEIHPLVADLLSLLRYNMQDRWVCMDWAAEYMMLFIHYILYIYLDLNTW